MRIITNRKIITTSNISEYSNIDGKSKKEEILDFQKWMNKAHPELGGKIAEDGVFKVNDEFYYKTYGAAYEKNILEKKAAADKAADKAAADKAAADKAAADKAAADKKKSENNPNKLKLTNLQLGLIIGGGAAVLITIIVLIAKK